jgi:pimeloyl-ACP methyl ester carboxylesterase
MDEAMLARIASQGEPGSVGQGELPAAVEALRRGDRTLLRLAANTGPGWSFEDDFRRESAGLNAATCVDFPTVWDVNAPVDVRRAQAAAGWAALPASTLAPFSTAAWIAYRGPDFCVEWPAPRDLEPVFVPGVSFPDVPTLILAGELDLNTTVADGRFVAGLFPRSRLIVMRNAGHAPGFFSDCAAPPAPTAS